MLKYNDITQNTYIQSWTFTEIIARESVVFLRFHVLYLLSWHVTRTLRMAVLESFIAANVVTELWTVSYLYGDAVQSEREVVHM
jgi:Ni,Fe-hydrogenase III component G